MNIAQLSTGFIDVPDQITLNIYAQGCKKRCKDCHNQDLQNFDGGKEIYLSDINNILGTFYMCNWICWLGGDIIYQEEAFKAFNGEFRNRGLDIALYTGKKIKDLSDNILQNVSLVIDGEWTGIPVTESGTNQKIWLRNSYDSWDLIDEWSCLELSLKEITPFSQTLQTIGEKI